MGPIRRGRSQPHNQTFPKSIGRLEADGLVTTDLLRRCTIAPAYA